MALPSFSKSAGPSFTFSRADGFPRLQPRDSGQLVGESEGGQVRVATLRDDIEFIPLIFAGQTRLPAADYTGLLTFLLDSRIDRKANTFTFTDSDGSTATVRYFDGLESFALSSSGFYQGTLVLRKEL